MRFTNIRKIVVSMAVIAALALPSTLLAGTMGLVHKGVDTAQDVDKTVSGSSHQSINQGVDTAQDVSKKFDGTSTEEAAQQATDAAKKEAVSQGVNAATNALQ